MQAKPLAKHTAKFFIKLASIICIFILLIITSLWVLRAPLVQWLARQPLPNDWSLQLTGLTSSSITHWEFKQFSLVRAGVTYFTLNEGILDWNPAYLWQRKLLVHRLSVDSAIFYSRHEKTPSTFSMPDLTQLPSVAANQATIAHLIIKDPQATANLATDITSQDYAFVGDVQLLWNEVLLKANGKLNTQLGATIAHINTRALENNQWEISSTVDEPAGGMLARQLGLPAEQALSAQANVAINYLDARYQINLLQLDFPWRDQQIKTTGTLWLNNTYTNLEVRELLINTNGHNQRIHALITPDDQQVQAQLDQFPIALIAAWVPLEGGDASGEFKLYHQSLNKTLSVEASAQINSRYRGWPLNLTGDFNYLPENILTLKKVTAIWGEGQLKTTITGDGQFDLHGEQNDLTARAKNFGYEHLRNLPINWLNQPNGLLARELHDLKFSAQVSALTLKGPLKTPQVTYNLDAQTQWRQHEFALHLQGEGNLKGARLQQTQVQQSAGRIDLNGTLDWQGDTNNLKLDFTQWGQAFWPVYQLESLIKAQGLVNGQAQLTGALNAPIIDTQLSLAGLLPLNNAVPFLLDSQAKFQYSFNKSWPEGLSLLSTDHVLLNINEKPRLELTGRYSNNAIDLTLTCPQWDSEINQLIGLPLASGEGNFSFNLTGTVQEPTINGQWHYTIPFVAQPPLQWQGIIATQERDLVITSTLDEADHNLAQFKGRYPLKNLSDPSQINAQVELKTDLAASRLFLDSRRYPTGGQLNLDLTLAGSTASPQVNGALHLKDGYFADKLLGNEFKKINLDLALLNNQLNVEAGTLSDGGNGSLALTGGCPHLYPDTNCQLKFALDHLQIIKNRQLNTQASGEINSSLNQRQINVAGALTLSPTTLTLSNPFGSTIKELNVEEIHQHSQVNSRLAWPSPLIDIEWTLGGNSQVRGRGLEAQIAGALRTQGPLNNLAYNGNFYTTKGTMELFNKRFILDTGDIRLAPGQIYLNIPANYQSRVNSGEDLTIQARLHGDLNHLTLDLQSTPTLPPDEVLARLIFGKQIQTITPFEGIQLAAAVQRLRSGDGFNLMDSARSLLGVDRLNIDSQKNTDGSTGVNVGVGKYISDKVYLEIQRTPNPNTPWQGQIEVELTPSVNFESNTGDHGQGGAKLLWRRDY